MSQEPRSFVSVWVSSVGSTPDKRLAPSSIWVSILSLPSCEGKDPLTRVSLM